MLRVLLIGGGALVGLVIIVMAVGYQLPVEHTAAVAASFPQPPDVVFGVITDFAAMPDWRPGLKEVQRRDDRHGHPVWVEVRATGPLPMEVELVDAPPRMVATIVDEGLPFGGSWTYDVTETAEGGSRLTITERGRVYNPLFRFISRFVTGYHGTATRYLQHLGERLGTETEPERVQAAPA